jgi:hypothetical protein
VPTSFNQVSVFGFSLVQNYLHRAGTMPRLFDNVTTLLANVLMFLMSSTESRSDKGSDDRHY